MQRARYPEGRRPLRCSRQLVPCTAILAPVRPTPRAGHRQTAMGIFWALALIVALIYAILLLRADNHAKAASWRCSHSSSHGTHRAEAHAPLCPLSA